MSKSTTASNVEGAGGLSCINPSHDEPFIASTEEELKEHYADGKHFTNGQAPCAICSKVVVYEQLAYGKKPMCDECKAELTG